MWGHLVHCSGPTFDSCCLSSAWPSWSQHELFQLSRALSNLVLPFPSLLQVHILPGPPVPALAWHLLLVSRYCCLSLRLLPKGDLKKIKAVVFCWKFPLILDCTWDEPQASNSPHYSFKGQASAPAISPPPPILTLTPLLLHNGDTIWHKSVRWLCYFEVGLYKMWSSDELNMKSLRLLPCNTDCCIIASFQVSVEILERLQVW